MKASNLVTKETAKLCKKISASADLRTTHFNNVAVKMGYKNQQEAFDSLGQSFIKKARIGAPSINEMIN